MRARKDYEEGRCKDEYACKVQFFTVVTAFGFAEDEAFNYLLFLSVVSVLFAGVLCSNKSTHLEQCIACIFAQWGSEVDSKPVGLGFFHLFNLMIKEVLCH